MFIPESKMTATFETLLKPGFQHCAEEIFSNLNPEDLKNCSLVSKRCNDIIFKQNLKSYKDWVNLMKIDYERQVEEAQIDSYCIKPDSGWIEIFEYLEHLGECYKICAVKELFPTLVESRTVYPLRFHRPICNAIEENQFEFLKIILDSPADFNVKRIIQSEGDYHFPEDSETPMMVACGSKNVKHELFDLLMNYIEKKSIELEGYIKVDCVNSLESEIVYNVLDLAIQRGNSHAAFALVKFISEHPKYRFVIKPNLFRDCCVHFDEINTEFFIFLIENSEKLAINLNARLLEHDAKKQTGLHYLVKKQKHDSNADVIIFMLENSEKFGIEVDVPDRHEITPFIIACENDTNNQEKVLKAFLDNKHLINLNARNGEENALDLVIRQARCTTKSVTMISEVLGETLPVIDMAFGNLLVRFLSH